MTAYRLFVMEEAETDLDDAYIWYELQKAGLGIVFIEEINKAFKFIMNHPKSSARQYKGSHRYVVTKFPYSIYYNINHEELQIGVFAVLHHKREPGIWKKRKR